MVPAPAPSTPSTPRPASVKSWARRWLSTVSSTKSRIQWTESFMSQCRALNSLAPGRREPTLAPGSGSRGASPAKALSKLLQKAHISLEDQLNVIHAVLQQGEAVDAHAKGESGDSFGVVAAVLHKFENIRIHHAATQNFDPSGLLARTAGVGTPLAAAPADEAGHVELRARLGERKKRRTEERSHARTEQGLHGMIERALQIAKSNVGVDRQALDLMEHGRMAGIGRIVAMHFAGNHEAYGRRRLLHGADLHRRRVGA